MTSTPDYDTIRAEVAAELAAIADPHARRTRAEEIHHQASTELAALKPERDRLVTAVAAYERPDVKALTRIGMSWQQMAWIATVTAGTQHTWRALDPDGRAEAARAACIPHDEHLWDKAQAVCARYDQAEARARAATAALYDQTRAQAAAEVAAELAAIADSYARRARATEIRDQANMEMAVLRPDRDQHIASAALYEPQENLHLAFGLGYSQMKRITLTALGAMDASSRTAPPWPRNRAEAAQQAGIPRIPAAVERGTEIALHYEAAEARHAAALAHIEAAHEEINRGGRVLVAAVERPDFIEIRRRAAEEIREQFAKLAVRPEDRLRMAAEEVERAEEDMSGLRPERDQALASLAFYTTATAPYLSAGLTPHGQQRVLEKKLGLPRGHKLPPRPEQPTAARAAGIPYVKTAAEELPQIATSYEAAKARRNAAIEIRDAAVRALHAEPHRWSQPRIAEFIGRDVAVINRIIHSPQP